MNREISLEELKKIQIEILDEVHSYCEQKGLVYFLSSGTLIGAIRHKGYIPWDDDIDIYMPRPDYEKFVSTFNGSADKYRVISLSTDKSCSFAYAKVERRGTRIIEQVDHPMEIGVNIDVFPVDGVPDEEKCRNHYFSKIQRLRDAMILKDVSVNWRGRSLLKNFALMGGKLLLSGKSLRSLAMRLDKTIDKSLTDSQYVCNMVLGNGIKSIFSRKAIDGTVDVEFEGKKYKTMIGWDEYLTKTYGDYLTPPIYNTHIIHLQRITRFCWSNAEALCCA